MVTGRVVEIRRFPVKSMRGEEPVEATLDERGMVGYRAHAVIDAATGKVASAKDPRRWRNLLASRAAYVGEPASGAPFFGVL